MPVKRFSTWLMLTFALLLLSGSFAGCTAKSAANDHPGTAMASMDGMPGEVKSAPITVQQAYQFAVANPDTLQQFPCYCGCGKMGHTSNYSCYVTGVESSGAIQYDTHALGCSICVDITQDVMRLQQAKKSIPEIQAYIDSTYSRYGPSNLPGAAQASAGSTDQAAVCDGQSNKPCPVPAK